MNKEFVTYEQALALKELGFDESCPMYWRPEMDGSMQLWYHQDTDFWDAIGSNNSDNAKWVDCTSPLKQQVFRWFREKGYDTSMLGKKHMGYNFIVNGISITNGGENSYHSNVYETYEEAEDALIDKLIEICKNK